MSIGFTTKELIQELDKELKSINFPGVTFVPVDREKREKDLEEMMARVNKQKCIHS